MIADILPRYQEVANGTKKAFTVPFDILDSSYINVYLGSTKQTSGFSINVSGKKVTFTTAPSSSTVVTIVRVIPTSWEQEVLGAVNAETLNNIFTVLIAKMQTLEEGLNRAIKTDVTDTETGSTHFLELLSDAIDSLGQANTKLAQVQSSATQALSDISDAETTALSNFNSNATSKTNTFNTNASNKTTAFDNNYTTKKAAVDAKADEAAASAALAKKWAIGDPSEPTGHSAEYWAEQASLIVGDAAHLSLTETFTGDKTFEKEIKAELASYVAYNGSTNTLPYKKIGEVVLTGTSASAIVPFLYFRTNVEKSSNNYLGKIVLRTDGTTAGHINTSNTGVALDEVPDYINSGDINFYILYKESTPDSSKVTFEFWVYVKNTWSGLSITPLKQSTGGTGYSMTNWTWYNNPTGVAEIPSGYTGQIEKNIISNYIATPAASDDSKKAANTEFVHDAIALDAVTLTGNQDISDIKRFGASNCLMVTSANITKGTNPTATQYLNIGFTEKNATTYTNRIGCVEVALFTDGKVTSYLKAYKNVSAGTATADLSVTYPASGNPYANCPTPTEDTTSSTQIDTVGARNTKLADYATTSAMNSVISTSSYLVLYGTSTSAADATAKIVEISSSYATTPTISAGQLLIVTPTITSTVADSTITVKKSSTTLLAAKTMKYNNANITTSTDSIVWTANVPSIFVYDGSYWQFLGHGLDNNTTYSAMSVSEGTTGTATSSRVMRADYLKQIIEGLAISQTNTYYDSSSSTLYIG